LHEGGVCRGDKFKTVSADLGADQPNNAPNARRNRVAHLIHRASPLSRRDHGARNLADLIHDGPRIVLVATSRLLRQKRRPPAAGNQADH